MKWLFLFLFCTSTSLGAQVQSIQKVSQKLNVTSLEEAKKVLLVLASLNAIEKMAPELGYDFNDFKLKLDKAFDEYFETYKAEKLVEKFGQKYDTSLTEIEKKNFLGSLDLHRDEEYVKFSKIADSVLSYSFKSIAQDPIKKDHWGASIELSLDRIRVQKLLRRITSEEIKLYSKVWLMTEIDLNGFTWEDLGLDKETSFISPMNTSWIKWLEKNIPTTVDEVGICSGDCLDFYKQWLNTPQEKLASKIDRSYAQNVFLKLTYTLQRSSHVESLQENTFEWGGRIVLLDINTKRILGSYELLPVRKKWQGVDKKDLNSALATQMYLSPLKGFNEFMTVLQVKKALNRVSRLVIKGSQNLGDALILMEILRTRGTFLGLETSLDFFQREEVQILCFYQGEEKSFSDLLSGVKELKSSHGYRLVNEFTGFHYLIKLVTE